MSDRIDYPCGCWAVRDGWFTRVSTCDAHARREPAAKKDIPRASVPQNSQ